MYALMHSLLWPLIGLTTGLAAWTKNEGLLFLLCFLVAHALIRFVAKSGHIGLRQVILFSAGLLPILGVITYFKIKLATPNDVISTVGLPLVLSRLVDFSPIRSNPESLP